MHLVIRNLDSFTRNYLIFLMSAPLFYFLLKSIDEKFSIYSFETILSLISNSYPLFILCFLSVFTLLYFVKLHKFLAFFYLGYINFLNAKIFIIQFDKSILLSIFFFLIISFYFFTVFLFEKDDACFWPHYSADDLWKKPLFNFPVSITPDGMDNSLKGFLTNWSENSCFLIMTDPLERNFYSGELVLKLQETEFRSHFKTVSFVRDLNGFGLKLEVKRMVDANESYSWQDYYNIISSRGIIPNDIWIHK